jgi:hypothetical protein
MTLFSKAENTSSFLKMGIMGFAGSGKTYTATSVAIGLHKLAGVKKPIFFLDTETGSDWVKPRVEAAGIELFTAKTRAFCDLLEAVPEAEASSSLLLVDSLTHFWVELTDAYMRGKKRTRLQFEDWAYLKSEWRKFTDAFVNSNLHIIVCGRAGFEYDYSVDEETGKKQLEKTGIKMKAEGEMGYEPSLLVLMEREMDMASKTNKHFAKVVKDRATLLDGKEFPDPTFENFLPHIQLLNLGGRHLGVDTTRTSVSMIPADVRDNRATQRKIVLDEIESLIVIHYPGQSAEDKKTKKELLRTHFQASWTEMDAVMPLERLRKGYDTLHFSLEGTHSRYHQERLAEQMNDELPGDLAPPKQIERIDRVVPTAAPAAGKVLARIQRNLDRLKVRAPELAPADDAKPEVPYWEAALAAE